MLKDQFEQFLTIYDADAKDAIWAEQSRTFRRFWNDKIVNGSPDSLTDDNIDPIVRILDRHGKGNNSESEAIAKAMVAQGAWRRMFHELCSKKDLSKLITQIFETADTGERAANVDSLYEMNKGRKNNLTGPSGNVINAFLAAYDPMSNISIISMKDRRLIIEHFGFPMTFDYDNATSGVRFANTNEIILRGFRSEGVEGSARTISEFCYRSPAKALWRGTHTVEIGKKPVEVSIPRDDDDDTSYDAEEEGPRESIAMQAIVAEIGAKMGMQIWIPKGDRSRILRVWHPTGEELLDRLPLNYDETAMKTIENIDVLWLNRRAIVRAFEVEHTTSIYSGLLRMADLLALLPNIDIKLHIVAPPSRSEKVFEEIKRPVFSLLEGGALSEKCTYISYDRLRELYNDKQLEFLKSDVLEKYCEQAE
ncbi:MAG TPA: hypothetical protein VLX91_17175 [Candidatus Acidoferrales bacterium]|nr:hypothetical protein [Candidatus Acidoferrales bacterium]